jgi:uncharacterized phage protein gp47/JayE
MPINIGSFADVVNRMWTDITTKLSNLDPTIFGSWIRGLSTSNAGRHWDNRLLVQQLDKELFPQTASGENLERWAGYENLTRFSATASSGLATATGTPTTTIPALTQWRSESGKLYTMLTGATIATDTISVTSLTRSGSTVTATTSSSHNFASNVSVTIAGAVETDYNGTFTITVTGADEFTYEITGTPSTPATGTITASCDCATIDIDSDGVGADTNLENGAILNLASPIAGVDSIAYVQLTGITGGQDEETDPELLIRTEQSRANPVANFNPTAIEKEVRTIQGVTRVKVKRITPVIGAVTVLFMRDNDDNPIPSASEVQEVKDVLDAITPAQSDLSDIVVTAPTAVPTDYIFSAISPDTPTMREAIGENLSAFYEDEVDFETDIVEDKYRSAIIDTIDPATGDILTSFTLTNPSGTISVTTDSIGTLGDVIF